MITANNHRSTEEKLVYICHDCQKEKVVLSQISISKPPQALHERAARIDAKAAHTPIGWTYQGQTLRGTDHYHTISTHHWRCSVCSINHRLRQTH